jgi:hypothetical protein
MPEVIGTDDEAFYRPRKPSITAPILHPDPQPLLLQPTVYDPTAKTTAMVGVSALGPLNYHHEEQQQPLLLPAPPSSESPQHDDGLSSVQRSIEADLLAEARDAAARSSALRRAKEMVLMKLSREFCKRKTGTNVLPHSKDSAAVVAGLSALNLGMGLPVCASTANLGASCAPTSSASSMGLRIREGLFGRSLANVASTMGVADHRSIESQSALVPLMFSRS